LSELGSDHRPKTFIKLPPDDIAYLFVPVHSSADNEINAHTSMFNPKKTDHYYELGSDSISLINEMVARFQRKKQDRAIANYPYYPPLSSPSISSTKAESSSTIVSPKIVSSQPPNISKPASLPHYPPPNYSNPSSSNVSSSQPEPAYNYPFPPSS
jgi:hypothetical protein